MSYLSVFLGGGFGSVCRYGIAKLLAPYQYVFPYATLLANILSCIILGYFTAWALKSELSESFKVFFMVGFCGGFSTFSTFTNETIQLLQAGNIFYAFANILLNIILCIIAIYIGYKLTNF